jgi:hypothetical protein
MEEASLSSYVEHTGTAGTVSVDPTTEWIHAIASNCVIAEKLKSWTDIASKAGVGRRAHRAASIRPF